MAPPLFAWRHGIESADELSAADRHVALVIAGHMDVNGEGAHPSIRTIAAKAARKPHTVIESIAWLEAAGWLTVKRTRSRGAEGVRLKSSYVISTPTIRKTKAGRADWLRTRKMVPQETPRVGTEETPPDVVPIRENVLPLRAKGVAHRGLKVVPRGAMELPTTSSTNSPVNSSTGAYARATTEDLTWMEATLAPDHGSRPHIAAELERRRHDRDVLKDLLAEETG